MSKHLEEKTDKLCPKNKHKFIPIAYKLSSTAKIATQFMCECCLITVDKTDVEVINANLIKQFDELSQRP